MWPLIMHKYLDLMAGYWVAIPLVLYTTSMWILHESHGQNGLKKWLYPLSSVVVLIIPWLSTDIGYTVFAISIVYALRLVISKYYSIDQ